jgi:hypothetical protein
MVVTKQIPSPDKPEDALAAVVALRLMADRLERETVKEAIKQGWTWAQIAEALGVSKQAAHKKHAAFIKTKDSEANV